MYSYWRSSSAWRVRVVLALKGIKYDYVAVPLLEKAQNAADYALLNASEEVPTLTVHTSDDEKGQPISIGQSLAIIDFIESTYPGASVYPQDPIKKARALQLALIVVSGIQPLQNLKVLQTIGNKLGNEEKMAWAHDVIVKGLASLEKEAIKEQDRYSKENSGKQGKYLVGDDVSIADVCLVPQLYNARRFNGMLFPFFFLVLSFSLSLFSSHIHTPSVFLLL